MAALPAYKTDFLSTCVEADALKFGSFVLKSGRTSPYFFNAGLFHSGKLVRSISTAFAQSIRSAGLDFDVLFGPAYKGIPLAATTVDKLATMDETLYGDVHYSFNRKEAKSHGDGGTIVGAPLKGQRVVIIDDVITAGTAIREAIDLIDAQGGILVGIVVALDRQEKTPNMDGDDSLPAPSAIGQVRKQYNVPVEAIINLDDLIRFLESGDRPVGTAEDMERMKEYRRRYQPTE